VATRPLFTICLLELLKRQSLFALHAAAAARHGRGVLVAGPSGSGKSTISLALLLAGWNLLGDDIVFLREEGGQVAILPFPDEIDASAATLALFPELENGCDWPRLDGYAKYQLSVERLGATTAVGAVRPALVLLPQVDPRRDHALAPASPEEVLLSLVPNILLTEPETSRLHLDLVARLARETAAFELALGPAAEALPPLLDDTLAICLRDEVNRSAPRLPARHELL
jgi:hypothetical protein